MTRNGEVNSMRAFILVNVEPSSEEKVLQHVKSLNGVEEAHITYGTYDLALQVQSETPEDLKEVTHKIRTTDQVRSTLTLMLIDQ